MHDLALIYQALAHGSDDRLTGQEINSMAIKLKAWDEEFDLDRIKRIMNEVMLVYVGGTSQQMLEAAIASISQSLSKTKRIKILNDLADIATADGIIVMGEVNYIQHLARAWDIDKEVK